MLQVTFSPALMDRADDRQSMAPAESYRLERDQLHRGDAFEILARLGTSGWHFVGGVHSAFRLVGTACIRFEGGAADCSRSFGPFSDIRGEAGLIWVAGWQRFASFQRRTRAWHAFALGTNWPVMVFTAETLQTRTLAQLSAR